MPPLDPWDILNTQDVWAQHPPLPKSTISSRVTTPVTGAATTDVASHLPAHPPPPSLPSLALPSGPTVTSIRPSGTGLVPNSEEYQGRKARGPPTEVFTSCHLPPPPILPKRLALPSDLATRSNATVSEPKSEGKKGREKGGRDFRVLGSLAETEHVEPNPPQSVAGINGKWFKYHSPDVSTSRTTSPRLPIPVSGRNGANSPIHHGGSPFLGVPLANQRGSRRLDTGHPPSSPPTPPKVSRHHSGPILPTLSGSHANLRTPHGSSPFLDISLANHSERSRLHLGITPARNPTNIHGVQHHPRPLVSSPAFTDPPTESPRHVQVTQHPKGAPTTDATLKEVPRWGNIPCLSLTSHRNPSVRDIWKMLDITNPSIIETLEERIFRHLNVAIQRDCKINPTPKEYARMVRDYATLVGRRYVQKRESRRLGTRTPATSAHHEQSSSRLATQPPTTVSSTSSLPVARSAYVSPGLTHPSFSNSVGSRPPKPMPMAKPVPPKVDLPLPRQQTLPLKPAVMNMAPANVPHPFAPMLVPNSSPMGSHYFPVSTTISIPPFPLTPHPLHTTRIQPSESYAMLAEDRYHQITQLRTAHTAPLVPHHKPASVSSWSQNSCTPHVDQPLQEAEPCPPSPVNDTVQDWQRDVAMATTNIPVWMLHDPPPCATVAVTAHEDDDSEESDVVDTGHDPPAVEDDFFDDGHDPPVEVDLTVQIPSRVIDDDRAIALVQVVPPDADLSDIPLEWDVYPIDLAEPGGPPDYDEESHWSDPSGHYWEDDPPEDVDDEPDEGPYYSDNPTSGGDDDDYGEDDYDEDDYYDDE